MLRLNSGFNFTSATAKSIQIQPMLRLNRRHKEHEL